MKRILLGALTAVALSVSAFVLTDRPSLPVISRLELLARSECSIGPPIIRR